MQTKHFIQHRTEDRKPEKRDQYYTDKGKSVYNKTHDIWHNGDGNCWIEPEYWFEEVRMPSEEETCSAIDRILDLAKCGLYHNYPHNDGLHKEQHKAFDKNCLVIKNALQSLTENKK